ncbi:MAG: AMP-binding protein [Hyphomonadaceae bacterium]
MNAYIARLVSNIGDRRDSTFCRLIGAHEEVRISWEEFGARCGGFAYAYRRAELRDGDLALLFLKHTPDLYGAFFGAMAAGCVPSFMPTASPRQDPKIYWHSHAALLERLKPRAIVASADTFADMEAAGLDLGTTHRVLPTEVGNAPLQISRRNEDDIALLQHSSGTTGLKKGVALSYRAITAQIESYARALDLSDADRIASWLPLYHDMGLIACAILPVYFGIPITHIDPLHWVARPDLMFSAIAADRATLAWMPNFAFEHMATVCGRNADRYDLSTIRAWINCSEPCKPRAFDRFADAFTLSGVQREHLQCCYAMAESVFAVTQTEIGGRTRRLRANPTSLDRGARVERLDDGGIELLSCGPTIGGIEVSVHDESRQPLPEGHVGEIALRGDFMFSGYNLDPERTAERCQDGRYFTRDMGFLMDGELYVLGRLDDMLIINGRNLYAHEVETELSSVAGLKAGRAVAVARHDPRTGSDALVVIAEKTSLDPRDDRELTEDVVNRLNAVFSVVPQKVVLVEEGWLVKTTSGKISRKENLIKFLESTKREQ